MAAVEAEGFTIKAGMKNSKVRVTVIQNEEYSVDFSAYSCCNKAYVAYHVAEHCLDRTCSLALHTITALLTNG